MSPRHAGPIDGDPEAFAEAQRAKGGLILEAALRVLLDELGPRAVLERKQVVVHAWPDRDRKGEVHFVRLDRRGVLSYRVGKQIRARSLPLGFNTRPDPDPKFKPPRWLV